MALITPATTSSSGTGTVSATVSSSDLIPQQFQMLGCLGKQGPYTFYRGMKGPGTGGEGDGGRRTYWLGDFMALKIWPDSALLSIGELQLLWVDKNEEAFCSLKLYFLPENTPDGRLKQHGEDEVIALNEGVILRGSDLLSILVDEGEWDWGFRTPSSSPATRLTTPLAKAFVKEVLHNNTPPNTNGNNGSNNPNPTTTTTTPTTNNHTAKTKLDNNGTTSFPPPGSIIILNYPRYIRLRTVLKRLEGSPPPVEGKWLGSPYALALGALNIPPNSKVLYAKETFDHPDIEDNELFCNHLAPKLKGGKKGSRRSRKRKTSGGSVSNESVGSSSGGSVGSFKENEAKSLNGKIKQEIRRGSITFPGDSNNALQIMKVEGGKGSWGNSNKRRSNGLSASSENKAALLGPALTELAQKLEKSNALQILPIRPLLSSTSDDDNHPKKRRKTEIISLTPLHGSLGHGHGQGQGQGQGQGGLKLLGSGPYDIRTNALPPPVEKAKNGEEDGALNPQKAHSDPFIFKLSKEDMNWKPLKSKWTSPCLYSPLPSPILDPFEGLSGKRGLVSGILGAGIGVSGGGLLPPTRPIEVQALLNYSQDHGHGHGHKAVSSNKDPLSRLSSSLVIKSCTNNKGSSSGGDLRTGTGTGAGGVRLTSEVTLFPSSNKATPTYPSSLLDGVMSMSNQFTNPRQAAKAGGNSGSGSGMSASSHGHGHGHGHHNQPEIDIQPWKPQQSAATSSTSSGRVKEQVTASKSSNSGKKKAGGTNSSMAGSGSSGQGPANNSPNSSNPFLHPYSNFSKMDPAYLAYFANAAPLFMPPPPHNFLQIPGAVEQFYKDFFIQAQQGLGGVGVGIPGGIPGFPQGWPLPPGSSSGGQGGSPHNHGHGHGGHQGGGNNSSGNKS